MRKVLMELPLGTSITFSLNEPEGGVQNKGSGHIWRSCINGIRKGLWRRTISFPSVYCSAKQCRGPSSFSFFSCRLLVPNVPGMMIFEQISHRFSAWFHYWKHAIRIKGSAETVFDPVSWQRSRRMSWNVGYTFYLEFSMSGEGHEPR